MNFYPKLLLILYVNWNWHRAHNCSFSYPNGLIEFFIKWLQLIVWPLLLRTQLPFSAWGHAILHVAAPTILIWSFTYHEYSLSQLVLGQQPNVSYLRIFCCATHVPIAFPEKIKMGSQRCLGIYIGFDCLFIIRYLEP